MSTPPSEAGGAALRILTFNVWGIRGLSPDPDARMPRIAAAIDALDPDVVLLQEAWADEHAAALAAGLEAAGLPHQTHRSASGIIAWGSTGLFVASRSPLRDVRWIDFESGQLPHTPYHADWAGTKAALLFEVDTAGGPVTIATTHMQASYATGDYEPVRLAQTLQLVEALRASGPASDLPTLVAGDLNFEPGEVGERVLRGMLGLRSAFEGQQWDAVLHRDGRDAGVRVRRAQKVLTERVTLPDGTETTLSDHPGLLVELEVSRAAAPVPAVDASAAVIEATQAVGAELERTAWQQRGAVAAFVAFAWLGLHLARRRPWRRPLWGIVWISLTFVGLTYAAYFAWGYAPRHLAAMQRAELRARAALAP